MCQANCDGARWPLALCLHGEVGGGVIVLGGRMGGILAKGGSRSSDVGGLVLVALFVGGCLTDY